MKRRSGNSVLSQLDEAHELSEVIDGISAIIKKHALETIIIDKNQLCALAYSLSSACVELSRKLDTVEASIRATMHGDSIRAGGIAISRTSREAGA